MITQLRTFLGALYPFCKRHPQVALTILYCGGSVFVPNTKLFFVWSAIFFLALFTVSFSFFQALIFSLLPVSLFSIGQLYQFVVVPPEAMSNPLYQYGRSLFFTFSPAYFLLILSIGAVPLLFFRLKKMIHVPLPFVLLFLLESSQLFSALNTTGLPVLSMLYTISGLGLICWGVVFVNYLHNNKMNSARLLHILFTQLIIILLFHSTIVLGQTFFRSTLGLKIEQTDQIPYFGAGADEDSFQFRPVGLRSHSNELGNEILVLSSAFLFLGAVLYEKNVSKLRAETGLFAVTGLVSLLVMILTQSRSVYLGIAAGLVLLFLHQRARVEKVFHYLVKKILPYRFTLFILIVLIGFMVGRRLWKSQFSFGEAGGYTVRVQLLEEAQSLIQQNWWWGVGPGMFIPSAFQHNPDGVMKVFPEAVHNGFYLFLTEGGVMSLSVAGFFLYFLTRKVWNSKMSKLAKWVYASALVGQLVVMIFQPFVNFVTYFTILVAIILEVNLYAEHH
jgi:hypothetical protein